MTAAVWRCPRCTAEFPRTAEHFQRDSSQVDGLKVRCKPCSSRKLRGNVVTLTRAEYEARAEQAARHLLKVSREDAFRMLESGSLKGTLADAVLTPMHDMLKPSLGSDYDTLAPEDFDVASLNPGAKDPDADKEKKQEYSRRMGEYARDLASGDLTARDGAFIGALAEQERRFQNRRLARSTSITAANEALHRRLFAAAAEQYLADKVVPAGYALKPANVNAKRTAVLLLSDLHIGAELSELNGDPVPFGAVQEARRLEYVVRQAADYKPQYRAHSDLLLIIAGDVIDGLLLHDLRDGAPLTEQMAAFWSYFSASVGLLAHVYPRVHVVCQPGNHGRNKLRHPGRATSSKWDGVEWQLYYALRMMCRQLLNVTWQLDFRALSVVDLYGKKLGITHADTEVFLQNPVKKAEQNIMELAVVNALRLYDCELDAIAYGHYHTAASIPGKPWQMANGMLVPPNGHARSRGYVKAPCGQWLWESVEGHVVGDQRFILVGKSQDEDERLGTIVKPFRFAA